MLKDLNITNYRCFKDLNIDGLSRVNLLVGRNNSGKTSLLEAIYLLACQAADLAPLGLIEILERRGEFTKVIRGLRQSPIITTIYPISHIFLDIRMLQM